MSETIKRNSFKRIEAILRGCALIREVDINDMSDRCGTVTADYLMGIIRKHPAKRVTLDDSGNLRVAIHGNWFFTAYQSASSARGCLTPEAFDKYFPGMANKLDSVHARLAFGEEYR